MSWNLGFLFFRELLGSGEMPAQAPGTSTAAGSRPPDVPMRCPAGEVRAIRELLTTLADLVRKRHSVLFSSTGVKIFRSSQTSAWG